MIVVAGHVVVDPESSTAQVHEDLVPGSRSEASRGLIGPRNPTRPTGYLRASSRHVRTSTMTP